MAQTLEFSEDVKATDSTLTLEVTPSSELGVEVAPAPKPVLEIAEATKEAAAAPELTMPTYDPAASAASFTGSVYAPAAPAATAVTSADVTPAVPAQPAAPVIDPATVAASAAVAAPAVAATAASQPAAYAAQPAASAYQPQGAPAGAAYGAAQNAQTNFGQTYATYPSAPADQLYMYPEAIYPMTEKDRNLRMVAFILNLISTVSVAWTLIPLAWMVPTTVISWKIYKGTRQSTTVFGVLDLLFTNVIAGILLLVADNND